MNYAPYLSGHMVWMEVPEMDILIKLFLLVYVLFIALLTIFSVIWILSLVFTHGWTTQRNFSDTSHKRI
jgi:uncharacterized protein HemY